MTVPTLQTLNLGTVANDATGDTLQSGGGKINSNFSALLTQLTQNFTATFPVASYGAVGDGVTNDTTAIQNAINAANTHGGGVVLLDALTYYIPGGLQLKQGVFIVGQGATVNTALNAYLPATGTWLKGNNTNPGIYWNNTPLAPGAAQLTVNQILATALSNVGVLNVGFDSMTRHIYAGELGNPALLDGGVFKNLIGTRASQWGFYFENVIYAVFENIRTYNMLAGATGFVFHGVSCTNYNFGNCSHNLELASSFGSNLSNCKGLVFDARAGAIHNDIVGTFWQSTTVDSMIASACGTVNTARAISLTAGQGINFPPDMPVVFNTSNTAPLLNTNGFGGFSAGTSPINYGLVTFHVVPFMLTANLIAGATSGTLVNNWDGTTGNYVLTFSDGETKTVTLTNGSAALTWTGGLTNAVWKFVTITGTGGTKDYIQVANSIRGAPITAGTTGSGFAVRWGFPNIQVAGWAKNCDPYNTTGSNSLIQSATFGGLDTEGLATTMILLQNGFFTINGVNFQGGASAQGTSYASRYVFRNATGSFSSNQGVTVDADFNTMVAAGVYLTNTSLDPVRILQRAPVGAYIDGANNSAYLQLGIGSPFTVFSLQAQLFAGGAGNVDGVYPGALLAQHTRAINFQWASFTFDGSYYGSNTYTFVGSGNVVSSPDTGTMQTLDGTAGGSVNTSQTGFPFEMVNLSTNALLINTASGQNWNGLTNCTQIKILPGGSFSARAQYNATGANSFWMLLSGDAVPYYTLNASNAIICGAQQRWVKVGTVTNATFSTASATNKVGIFTLPVAGFIHAVRLNCTTSFIGGGLATYTISVGNTGNVTKYMGANSVFTTGYFDAFLPGSESMSAATAIFANATASGNLNLATQGSADIWALVSAAA